MHVAIPLYPGYTALDAVGPYTVLAFAPGWTVTFAAAEPGPVLDDRGNLSIVATASYAGLPRPGPATRARVKAPNAEEKTMQLEIDAIKKAAAWPAPTGAPPMREVPRSHSWVPRGTVAPAP
jgi:putative intracellular protease/amidase